MGREGECFGEQYWGPEEGGTLPEKQAFSVGLSV